MDNKTEIIEREKGRETQRERDRNLNRIRKVGPAV